jgi:hypothetical protein
MLASFQIEIFFGFFLTAKLYDLNHTLRNHPLLTPLQTHEGLSEARHLPCEPTEVAVKKKIYQIFSQLALGTAEKIYAGIGGGFDLEFVYFPLGLLGRSVNVYADFKLKSHKPQHGFSRPFQELIG